MKRHDTVRSVHEVLENEIALLLGMNEYQALTLPKVTQNLHQLVKLLLLVYYYNVLIYLGTHLAPSTCCYLRGNVKWANK